jgi:hypothetical protein
MTYRVLSERMVWPAGSYVGADDLAGCNIDALVQGGHLVPGQPKPKKRMPVDPVPDDTADEPEEQ